MNTYEIEVYEASPEDMDNIILSLSNSSIGFNHEDGSPYIQIHIEPFAVNKAVEIINQLGFTTDEDES